LSFSNDTNGQQRKQHLKPRIFKRCSFFKQKSKIQIR